MNEVKDIHAIAYEDSDRNFDIDKIKANLGRELGNLLYDEIDTIPMEYSTEVINDGCKELIKHKIDIVLMTPERYKDLLWKEDYWNRF